MLRLAAGATPWGSPPPRIPRLPLTDPQWKQLLAILRGEAVTPPPVGFIVDCPRLPGWPGVEIVDHLSSETLWFEANRRAIETFPDVWFLPGFWPELGVCTEPSAFGCRCIFPRNEFPFAAKVITDPGQIANLKAPDPRTDGLLPFMLNRLRWARTRIEDLGHRLRFSVSRGPLNVATFLVAMKTDPEPVHRLLRIITDCLKQWHALQRETFPTIDGMRVLDDIVGFMGENDFVAVGLPDLRELFAADVTVKFFPNDAAGAKSIKYYPEIGINLYNPGVQTPLAEMRRLCGGRLTFLGTIPPRDVPAQGTPDQVRAAVAQLLADTPDHSRLILFCAGGVPPGVTREHLRAFLEAAK